MAKWCCQSVILSYIFHFEAKSFYSNPPKKRSVLEVYRVDRAQYNAGHVSVFLRVSAKGVAGLLACRAHLLRLQTLLLRNARPGGLVQRLRNCDWSRMRVGQNNDAIVLVPLTLLMCIGILRFWYHFVALC